MTTRDPDTVIGRWLEDGPTRVADASRRRMLAEILETPQQRVGLRFLRPGLARAALAASVVVALAGSVAIGLYPRFAQPGTVPVATPNPSVSTSPTSQPSTPASPVVEASWFQPPFEYDPRVLGTRFGDDYRTIAAIESGNSGVTIWSSPRGLEDPCRVRGGVPFVGIDALADHLRESDVIEVVSDRETVLDGHRAIELRFRVRDDAPCASVNLLVDWVSYLPMFLDREQETIVTVVDVDGETVVIERWSSRLDDWIERTRPFMDSIHFPAQADTDSP